jgi:hypothetical protein
LQGAILMWNTLVANNTAAAGAGIQIDKSPGSGGLVPAYLQAIDSIIQGNVATDTGGGITAATCDQIVLNNATFEYNIGAGLSSKIQSSLFDTFKAEELSFRVFHIATC